MDSALTFRLMRRVFVLYAYPANIILLTPNTYKQNIYTDTNCINLSRVLPPVVNWQRPKLFTPILALPRQEGRDFRNRLSDN